MSRIYNFAAGPSTLPLPALEEAAAKLVDYEGAGMSLIEMSHRGKIYDAIHNETVTLLRNILLIPDDFDVLFLQGGATMQFGMIPMAFLKEGATADFVLTGSWALRAVEDARLIGKTRVLWDGEDNHYTRIPSLEELAFNNDAAYVHICSNETIGGIQWQDFPDTGDVPLIADMSSDILSRPLPWDKLDMVFAGTQKNLAPSGMALVLIRKDFARKARTDLPAYFRYDLHISKNSLYNTPPTFVVWMTNLTLKWIQSIGGLEEIERRREKKAGLLYDMIDGSGGYYRNPVDTGSRSQMNVVWRLPDEDLEKKFLSECEKEGLSGLKGHRDVGGIRASLYNALPVEGVEALVDLMKRFMEDNG
ncbi:MAG TPA: 3-phosphoserine/phosphohydroxythreonine transaminase [Spirochaetota bacterium]|nr:3-phosphoserine/phosphohydroxythreonine transaminase [Spirochaetota bacterium]HPQ55153.1 3-phosphoserine/phosphohydroxythreonine transaminase [Spirochaetota bacterium]